MIGRSAKLATSATLVLALAIAGPRAEPSDARKVTAADRAAILSVLGLSADAQGHVMTKYYLFSPDGKHIAFTGFRASDKGAAVFVDGKALSSWRRRAVRRRS